MVTLVAIFFVAVALSSTKIVSLWPEQRGALRQKCYVCVANVMAVIAAGFSFLKFHYFNHFNKIFKLIYFFKLIFHCV